MSVPGKGGRPKGQGKTPGSGRQKGTLDKRTQLLRKRMLATAILDADTTIECIRRGAQYDIRRLLKKNGDFKPLHTLTEEEAWCIAAVDVVMKNAEAGDGKIDRVLKIKFLPRDRYVELAARHLGMLTDKVQVTADEALMERLEAWKQARRLEAPAIEAEVVRREPVRSA